MRVDVFIVEPHGKVFRARKLEDAELTEPTDFIKASEDARRGVRDKLSALAPGGVAPPPPPTLGS